MDSVCKAKNVCLFRAAELGLVDAGENRVQRVGNADETRSSGETCPRL